MRIQTFKKGIHPDEYKELSQYKSIEELPVPDEVFIPLQQHTGTPCQPVVEKGMEVKKGQLIGESKGYISSPVHASISGKVKTIDNFPHPLGIQTSMIQIVGDGKDEWVEQNVTEGGWESLSRKELTDMVHDAGIVGMGGAAFPTHVKLNPPEGKLIDTFILNGCECEPYLTADHRVMLEWSDKVILGVQILMKILKVDRGIIGIESNKCDAIELMRQNCSVSNGISVVPLKVKYPQGAEKMLIKAVLDREVPTDGLPMDVGVVVNNVGTAAAVAEAVADRKPLIERVVTVTGDGIKEPKNVLARIGTPFRNLIDFCGGLIDNTVKVVMGGPLMGLTEHSLEVPIVKATSSLLCLTNKTVQKYKAFPCIQCGACVSVCPMNLLPTRLARLSEFDMLEMTEDLGILNCNECGSCAYACPSHIPLVQWIRIGKLRVNENRFMQKKKE